MKEKLLHKVNRKGFAYLKKLYLLVKTRPALKNILFITGCQRSGTTLMEDIFNRDLNVRCYGESSELSSEDVPKILRLNPLPSVSKQLEKVKAPLIVLKPLVESQNLPQLLSYFENSKAVWMFRHYKDVAASNLKFLGMDNGIKDLGPIVENEPGNWRAEKCSTHVRELITTYYSLDMNPYDAATLFWYARNSLFFDLALDQDPRVLMVDYNDFVHQPDKIMREIYRHAGQPYPGSRIIGEVHTHSFQKGKNISLSPAVEKLAQKLLDRLEAACQAQMVQNL